MQIPHLPGKHRRERSRREGMGTHVGTVLVGGLAVAFRRRPGILHVDLLEVHYRYVLWISHVDFVCGRRA